jgi:hypothetical protein
MQVVLDGVRVFAPSHVSRNNPPPDIDQYSLEEIESVEVYAGPAQAPLKFSGADATCGTIVRSTKR